MPPSTVICHRDTKVVKKPNLCCAAWIKPLYRCAASFASVNPCLSKLSGSPVTSCIGAPPAEHMPYLHLACAFHLDGSPGFAVESVLDQLMRAAGNLNDPTSAMGFHAAREIYGFAPEVINEFFSADDAGHHRTGVDAHPERELAPAERALRHGSPHIKGQVDERAGMVGPRPWHA